MAIRSMTGFGAGTACAEGNRVSVELHGTNAKQLDLRFNLPSELAALESVLQPPLQKSVFRGRVSVQISYQLNQELRRSQVQLDEDLALHMANRLQKLAHESEVVGQITAGDLLRVPGIIKEKPEELPLEELQNLALDALHQAVEVFDNARAEEGARIAEDILDRITGISENVRKLGDTADDVVQMHRQKLQERMRQLGVELAEDDERLLREAAYQAERSDITEEITRLDSHTTRFKELMETPNNRESTGRPLDFLCQEMHRELNTIGAKTPESSWANIALEAKTELASVREQVQNVE